MATEQQSAQSSIIDLNEERYEQENLWLSSLKRLVKNRMAVVGIIIIIFFLLSSCL